MDKRNKESSAAVKAAAWAWYQHGSGGKSPTESEYAATRTFRAHGHGHGPSRFKRQLVIMCRVPCDCDCEDNKKTETESILAPPSNPSNTTIVGVGHSSSSSSSSDLFDAYEIKRITSQIDLLTGSNNSSSMQGIIRRVVSSPGGSGLQRKKTETKFLGLKIRHGVICGGSRNDVVEPTTAFNLNRGRLRSEKQASRLSESQQQQQ